MWATIGLVFAELIRRARHPTRSSIRREPRRPADPGRPRHDGRHGTAGRFPVDESLNVLGQRQVDATVDLGEPTPLCAPEKRTRQTAELLGLRAEVDPRLSDLDCGRWRGEVLGGVQPAELAVWLTEPDRAPHGVNPSSP